MSITFEARFCGQCEACDERIHVGDQVTYNDDDTLVHETCEPTTSPREPAVCPSCWLAHAGECA